MGTYHGKTFGLEKAPVTIEVTPTKIISTVEKLKGFRNSWAVNPLGRMSNAPGVQERLISEISGVTYQPDIGVGKWRHLVGIDGI